jgi:hypothetical protein
MTHRIRRVLAPAVLLGGLFPALALGQAGELNLLTDLGTPFPPGCLSIDLPEQPSDPDSLLVDNNIAVPSALSDFNDASVNVRVWRVACADEGYSVVLVRLEQIAGNPVVIPQVYAEAGDVDRPFHEAQLLTIPAAGNVGATGGIVTNAGTTFMLAVEPVSIDGQTTFLPEDYNEQFTVEFTWEAFSSAETVNFPVLLDRFEPSLDPPQFEDTVLNGRYSGQWILPGTPKTGLVLQIAERGDQNNVFVIFFTYRNGAPFWIVGNTEAGTTEPGPVTIDMLETADGEFISRPNQPADTDVPFADAGQITIRAKDCNTIEVDYDFTPLGEGAGSFDMERLIRIAGYDCNPWE